MARALQDEARLTAPDLIGHGAAPDWDPARLYFDQCIALIEDHLPGTPCHLVGHSFGAVLALGLALSAPERARSLTLIEPVLFCAATGQAGWRENDRILRAVSDQVQAGEFNAAAAQFLACWGAGQPFKALPTAQQEYAAARMPLIEAQNTVLYDDAAELLPRLKGYPGPTLLIRGSKSPSVIAEIHSHLADELTNAKTHLIDRAGHMAPITHPRAVAEALHAHWN